MLKYLITMNKILNIIILEKVQNQTAQTVQIHFLEKF